MSYVNRNPTVELFEIAITHLEVPRTPTCKERCLYAAHKEQGESIFRAERRINNSSRRRVQPRGAFYLKNFIEFNVIDFLPEQTPRKLTNEMIVCIV